MFDIVFRNMTIGQLAIWFFIYSFLGWGMECIVIRVQLKRWENRGFAKLPFCVIYGFGVLIAFMMFGPIENNFLALFAFGSIFATTLEFLTAQVMLKLFGQVWWNYDHLPFNYKGILCLESSIAWGVIAVILFGFVNMFIESAVIGINPQIAAHVGGVLIMAYLIDFTVNFTRRLNINIPSFDESHLEMIVSRIKRR